MEDKNFDLKLLLKIWNLLFKSDYVISKALNIAEEEQLDFYSKRLCDFVEQSISKNRRGPMPLANL